MESRHGYTLQSQRSESSTSADRPAPIPAPKASTGAVCGPPTPGAAQPVTNTDPPCAPEDESKEVSSNLVPPPVERSVAAVFEDDIHLSIVLPSGRHLIERKAVRRDDSIMCLQRLVE